MKTLRMVWLDPVIKDLQDADNTEFLVLEERLRSVYHKLDCDFRQQAAGSKSLCSNLAYIYELVSMQSTFVVFINTRLNILRELILTPQKMLKCS